MNTDAKAALLVCYRITVLIALSLIAWQLSEIESLADDARRHAIDAANQAGYATEAAKNAAQYAENAADEAAECLKR